MMHKEVGKAHLFISTGAALSKIDVHNLSVARFGGVPVRLQRTGLQLHASWFIANSIDSRNGR
jgi:hypothetical protein